MATRVPNYPVVDFTDQSVIVNTVAAEWTSDLLGNYTPIEPGTPFTPKQHSAAQAAAMVGMDLVEQKSVGDDGEKVQRTWAKPPQTQDIANWSEDYSGNAASYPIFTRRYLEKRDYYVKSPDGSLFSGIYRIAVTAAGTGYTSVPTVTISGGGGADASAIAILNNTGGIAKITLKNDGHDYTSTPTVSITGGAGAGATAEATIQPQNCLLRAEKAQPAPTPYTSLYLIVDRTYETLPGPPLAGEETSEFGPISTYLQTNVTGTGADDNPATVSSDYSPGDVVGGVKKSKTYKSFPTGYNYGYPIDKKTNIGVRTRKRLVANGTQGTITFANTVNLTAATVANPTHLTLASALPLIDTHWPFVSQEWVTIAGDSNCTPSINGSWPATIVDSTHVTIPVNVTAVAGSGFGTIRIAAPVLTEIQELNDRQSIEIGSQVASSTFQFANKTWKEWMKYDWPDVLQAIDAFSDLATSASSLTGSFALPVTLTWSWSANFNGEVAIRRGRYTGQTLAKIELFYSMAAPDPDAVFQIILRSGEIVVKGGGFHNSVAISRSASAAGTQNSSGVSVHYHAITLDNILTNGFTSGTLAAGSALNANIELKLTPSIPANFTPGDLILMDSQVQDGMLGMFMKKRLTLTVPTNFPS